MEYSAIIGVLLLLASVNLVQNQILGDSERAEVSCYSCSGIKCLRPTAFNSTKQCSSSTEGCVTTFYEYGGTAFRGCLSELPDSEQAKCSGNSNTLCQKCQGSLCNRLGPVDAKCVMCTSTTNSNCLQNPKSLVEDQCPMSIVLKQQCYVEVLNGVTRRGCITTPEREKSCGKNLTNCYACLTDGNPESCNTNTFPANRVKCYSCKGDTCKSKVVEYCNHPDDACISINFKGTQVKKCSKQLTTDETTFCGQYPRLCQTCTGRNCNSADVVDDTNPNTSSPSTSSPTTNNPNTSSPSTSSPTTSNPNTSSPSTSSPTTNTTDPGNSANLTRCFMSLFALVVVAFVFHY